MREWVAIVYDRYGDKVGSHGFEGDEPEVRSTASEWVFKNFGEKQDWSLHEVHRS